MKRYKVKIKVWYSSDEYYFEDYDGIIYSESEADCLVSKLSKFDIVAVKEDIANE